MLPLGDPDRHFWLFRSVARVIGLDLARAVSQGMLERENYSAIVNRCRTCPMVAACETWLATSSGSAATPPQGCLVAADIAQLKTMTKSKGAY
ncbi:MAG: DUF6455 family protein [Paracoccaceae bacterium]